MAKRVRRRRVAARERSKRARRSRMCTGVGRGRRVVTVNSAVVGDGRRICRRGAVDSILLGLVLGSCGVVGLIFELLMA
jgi:hypothetical protein